MKHKALSALFLALTLALSLCACSSGKDSVTTYVAEGITLSVPTQYADLLVTEAADGSGQNGILFSVYEKASLEAARNQSGENGGHLFSIGRVTEDEFRELLCQDTPGIEVFAQDENENHFIYYHPSDLDEQLVREGDPTNEDWDQWYLLTDWAATVQESLLAENPGLSPHSHTYTDLDLVLARIAHWQQDAVLTSGTDASTHLSTHEQSLPFVQRLLGDVSFVPPSDDIYPEGAYITLSLPNLFWTFDFFIEDGQTHHIRQVFGEEGHIFFHATVDEAPFPAGEIVAQWMDSLT